MFKMLGDFFLLAGRWEDALIWYAICRHFIHVALELRPGTMKLRKSLEIRMIPFGSLALVKEWQLRLLLKPGQPKYVS